MSMDLISSCRTCLSNNGIYNIFATFKSQKPTKVSCFEMMSSVLSYPFPAHEGEKLPVSICQKCLTKLTSAYKFKMIAEQSFKELENRFYSKILDENNDNSSDGICQTDANNMKEKVVCLGRLKADASDSSELESEPGTERGEADGGRLSDGFFSEADDIPLKFSNYSKEKCALPNLQNNKSSNKKEECEPTVCAVCGELVRNLRAHQRTHRNTHAPGRCLPCAECPKVFACYSGRKRHMTTHHLGQLFFCDICNKHYKRGSEHLRLMHSSTPHPFACALCPKAFLTRTLLRLHLSCHAQERSFSCPLCHKLFRNKSNRDIHRRSVHEKERNFICQHCSRGFFSSQDLKKHLWCHTKEKNYKCGECGKGFARSSNMRLHEKKHSGIKDVQCTLCSKGFYNKGALKNHMISHSQEKKHECKYCGLKFGRAYSRNKHHKTAHQN